MNFAPSAQEARSFDDPVDRSVPLAVAAFASLGAGAVHATAIGTHGAFPDVVKVFTATAAFQIGWGAIALLRPRRALVGVGVLGNLALLGGWILAKTSGIAFVDGLDEAHAPALADSLAAGLAALAVVAGIAGLVRPRLGVRRAGSALAVTGLLTVGLGVTGMAAASSPDHHGSGAAAGADHHGTPTDAATASVEPPDHHAATPAVVRPYDPDLPIDLGGIDGVTPTEQARAENLIASTLLHLPELADPAVAEAAGFQSIQDGGTGYEHFINPAFRNDGQVLDPDAPESLVYRTNGSGDRELVAAMYMAEPGTTLETVPELGGALTQWHVHGDLCFTPGPNSRVVGLTDSAGNCAPPFVRPEPVPMIHVWITPHPCGPFAALEGIAGGQIPEGETRLCDTAHGGH